MPAHLTAKELGHAMKSDGSLVTEVDLFSNDKADTLAKKGVEYHRVSGSEVQRWESLSRRIRGRAMWIGRVMAVGGVLAIQVPIATAKALPRMAGLTRTTTALDLFLRTHANLYGLPDLEPLRESLTAAGFGEVGEVNILPGGSVRYVWGRKNALDERS